MKRFKSLSRAGLMALGLSMNGAAFICAPAMAQNLLDVEITKPGESDVSKSIVISLNKSTIVEFGRPASDVFITNPLIADAAVQTDRRMVFRGVEIGQTNAFVFDENGNQMLNLEIRVEPDTVGLEEIIRRTLPQSRIEAEAVNSNVLLTGIVDSLSEADAALRIANAYLGVTEDSANGIVNMLEIAAKDQVLLQVRIVEMQRSLIKQLGIDIATTAQTNSLTTAPFSGGNLVPEGLVDVLSSQAFNVAATPLGGLALETAFNTGNGSVGGTLRALERIGVVRTLAEPNITALSGEPANFLAGGEFPIPVAQDDDTISVEFRPFGVGLGFTPIVLSEGRISLRLSTEVSELTNVGAFQGQSLSGFTADGTPTSVQGLTIPALSVRRAETTVELPSGQSMMIAGLIESSTRQTLDQVPGIKDVPILGALFRSRDFLNEETEMVVIVTPYLVDPSAPNQLVGPDEGFANASDAKTFLFGKLNRLYGENEQPANADEYVAPVGFIEE